MKSTMKLIFFITLFAGFSLAYSQPPSGGRMLLDAVDKTDEIIRRAREVVMESGSDRADQLLVVAERLQKMAKELAFQAVNNSNTDMGERAGRITMDARQRAEQAIAITHQSEENEDYVRRRLERTDDLIRRISENLGSEAQSNIGTIFETARDRQGRAQELFRNRQLKMALQLTIQTEKSLEKLADRARGYTASKKRYLELSERYVMLSEQMAATGVAKQSEANGQVASADQLHTQAETMAENDNFVRAEQVMEKAVEMLSRLTETAREPAKVKSALENLQSRADDVREKVASSNNATVQDLYQKALDHLAKASTLNHSGNFEAAAAQLQAARELLSRVTAGLGD